MSEPSPPAPLRSACASATGGTPPGRAGGAPTRAKLQGSTGRADDLLGLLDRTFDTLKGGLSLRARP
ncbi:MULTISPECIES: hypothetical protein [Streptomyces]|uniref:hypothetical protein n=1 Tax=Streptomyces TaxID=1883 RepID=UPI0013166973|nr:MULTISPECIES: hypothetical protein [Streptomyces]QGZ50686.1 hypothetical protein GPZ77_21995 [Streptomyces sp. QHH-9511]GGT83431.1 hypothetical protein GCM10010272_30150 [Streptomyces lateritius]